MPSIMIFLLFVITSQRDYVKIMNIQKIIFFILFLSVFACNKNKQHPVPYYSFDTYINLDLPSYQSLQGVGGWAYVSGVGSKGVVIYRQSIQNFVAWDR